MITQEVSRLGAAILEALQRTGQRAVLQRGWAGLGRLDLPSWTLAIDDVPHNWLFPRTAAVIHHGGAGTTAAALRAGVPSLALPFTGDQPFWGARAHWLGVGPAPISATALTSEALSEALDALRDVTMRRRAAAVGAALRAEVGVDAALRVITDG